MNNLKQLIKEFRELRQQATPGEWVVQQKSLSNFDHPYIFDRTYGAIFDPTASSTKLINRPNCDYVCYSSNNITKLLDAVEVLIEAVEFSCADDMWSSNGEYNEMFKYNYSEWYQDTLRKALQQADEKVR